MLKTISSSDRQRGRPREFSPDWAIERAMQVFWTKGYQGTSLPDLMGATKLSRGSLYAAFGDKHGLFLLALDLYISQALDRLDEELASGRNALDGLRKCMDGYVARTDGAAGQRGCLVVATTMELGAEDHESSKRIAFFFRAMETRLINALARAHEEGSLSRNVDPSAAAYMLIYFLEGLRVVRKIEVEPQRSRAAVKMLISSFLA